MARRHLVLTLALCLASSLGAVPQTLNYQGRLRTSGGANVPDSTGNTIVFRLFNAATGGSQVWTETWNSATSCISTTAGLFNATLGSYSALNIPFDVQYWLELQVNGDASPMSPRTALSAAPYAFRSKDVDLPMSVIQSSGLPLISLTNNGGGTGISGASSGNIGVLGSGPTGVKGAASGATGVGVLADYNGGGSALALKVSGPARFDMGSVTFAAHVDFSGATVTGLSMAVPVPLNLSGSQNGVPIIKGTNSAATGGGLAGQGAEVGVSGTATLGGTGVGVLGIASSSGGAGVQAVNSGSGPALLASGSSTGLSATVSSGIAVYGINNGGGGFIPTAKFLAQGTNRGVEARNTFSGAVGTLAGDLINSQTGVYGLSTSGSGKGVWGQSSNGFGVRGEGQIGVAGVVTASGQVGVQADATGFPGSLALKVLGDGQFSSGSVSFSSHVDFSAANVTGLNLVPSAPLSLTGNAQSVIYANNNAAGGSPAIGVLGRSGGSTNSFGLVGSLSSSPTFPAGNSAVYGYAPAAGTGVYGRANAAAGSTGVIGEGFDVGVSATAATSGGKGVYGAADSGAGRGLEGYGYYGVYGSGAGVGVYGTTGSSTTPAVYGFNSSAGGPAAHGVRGDTSSIGASGVYGSNGAAGNSGNGVKGSNASSLGVGVYAENYGGGTALYVSGGAKAFGAVTFTGTVDFSGASVSGLSLPVPVPLTLTGSTAFSNAILTVTNNGNGNGIVGYATKPGALPGGSYPGLGSQVPAGLKGYSNVSNSAGVAGYSDITYTAGVGVIGIGSIAVGAFGRSDVSGAKGVNAVADGPAGVAIDANASSGIAMIARGEHIGASITANNGNGTGLYAKGRVALDADGSLQMRATPPMGSSGTGSGQIYFDSAANKFKVSENGGPNVDLVGGSGVSAPLSLSSSAGVATLYAYNNNVNGYGIYSVANTSNYAILADNAGTGPAVAGTNNNANGTGVYGWVMAPSNNATGVRGDNFGGANSGYGVMGSNNSSSGVAVYATNSSGRALLASGGTVGVSATSSSGSGSAVWGGVSSTGPAASFSNDGGGNAIFGTSSSGGAAIQAFNSSSGNGVYSTASNGTAVLGSSGGASSYGVEALNNNSAGSPAMPTALHAQSTVATGSRGAFIEGGATGISVTATSMGGFFQAVTAVVATTNLSFGRAILARNESASNGTAIEATTIGGNGVGVLARASGGAGSSKGVIAEGGFIGVSASGGAVGGGTGIYAAGSIAVDAQGTVDVRGLATVPAASNSGSGRIYFDSSANRFKVSENAGTFKDLLSGVTAPLNLTGSTAGDATIYTHNSAGGQALVVSGTTSAGAVQVVVNSGSGGNSYGILSSANNSTASFRAGVVGSSENSWQNPMAATGVHGYSNGGIGVGGIAINPGGRGLVGQGSDYGLSATASSSTGEAVYGEVNSTAAALHGFNNNTGGVGVLGQSKGSGHGVEGLLVSGSAGGAGVYGSASVSGTYGVYGTSSNVGGNGVYANNTAATVAGGGAALFANGLIRVAQGNVNLPPTTAITTNAVNGPHVRVTFNAGGAFTYITVSNTAVTANSSVFATFNTANRPSAYDLQVVPGAIYLHLGAPMSVSNGEGVNFLVINN